MTPFLLCMACLIAAGPPGGAAPLFRGQGAGPGYTPAATEAAAAAAKRTIVVDYMAAQTGLKDLGVFAPILERAEAYVHSARVEDQYRVDGGTQVELAAELFEDDLRRDMLKLLDLRYGRPAPVIVLLAESPKPGETPRLPKDGEGGKAGGVLREAIEEAGGRVIPLDPAALADTEEAGPDQMDAESLARLAMAHFAEAALAGSLAYEVRMPEGSVNVCEVSARLDVRIIQARSMRTVAEIELTRKIHSASAADALAPLQNDVFLALKAALRSALMMATANRRPEDEVQFEIDTQALPGSAVLLAGILEEVPIVQEAEILRREAPIARVRARYGGALAPLTDYIVSRGLEEGVFFDVRRAAGKDLALEAAPASEATVPQE